jgi:hypothetical protein
VDANTCQKMHSRVPTCAHSTHFMTARAKLAPWSRACWKGDAPYIIEYLQQHQQQQRRGICLLPTGIYNSVMTAKHQQQQQLQTAELGTSSITNICQC